MAEEGLFVRSEPAEAALGRLQRFIKASGLGLQSQSVRFTVKDLTATTIDAAIAVAQEHPILQLQSVGLSFTVAQNKNVGLTYRKFDALSHVIEFSHQQHLGDHFDKFFHALEKEFEIIDPAVIVQESLPDVIQQQLAFSQTALNELQTQTAQLGKYIAEAAQSNDQHIKKLVEDQQQHWQEQEAKLQSRVADQEKDFERRSQELTDQEREFNLREHRGVRRETLEKINREVDAQKKFILSANTKQQSYLIHAACIITIAATGCS